MLMQRLSMCPRRNPYLKVQGFCQCLKLVNGRCEVLRLQAGEKTSMDPGHLCKLSCVILRAFRRETTVSASSCMESVFMLTSADGMSVKMTFTN
jgi:hypothetical protein